MGQVFVPNVVGAGRQAAEAELDSVSLRHIAKFPFDASGDGSSTQQFPPGGTIVEAFSVVTVTYPTPLGPMPDSPVEGPEPPVHGPVASANVVPATFVREGNLLAFIERPDGLPFSLPALPTLIVINSLPAPIIFVDQDKRIYFCPPEGMDVGEITFTRAFLQDTGQTFDFGVPVSFARQVSDKMAPLQGQCDLLVEAVKAFVNFSRSLNINSELVRGFYSLVSEDALLALADILEAINATIPSGNRPSFEQQLD